MSDIAVIIPAYKTKFLSRTLKSLAEQSCHDFNVYIGDDASPEPVYDIVRTFEDSLDITYKKFGDNLGKTDLVAHWERCINMSSEPWIFFFSDDDVMPDNAIGRVKAAIKAYPDDKVFRFRLGIIDENDKVMRSNPEFTSDRSFANTVLSDYFSGKISSAACERVFHRGLLADGMVHFPLAWCSDVATWYKISEQAGSIVNISGAPVLWRNAEGNNISSSKGLDRQKASALTMFIAWLKENYHGNEDMRLKKSLYSFIKTNLRVSFSGNYTNADLYEIIKAYSRFDRLRATVLYLKCLKFCK